MKLDKRLIRALKLKGKESVANLLEAHNMLVDLVVELNKEIEKLNKRKSSPLDKST